MSDLKINIHGRNDHNTIVEKEYPRLEDSSIRLKAEGGLSASKNVRILFEPSAVRTLFDNIDWGRRYRHGDVEQAGILIGNYYRDSTASEVIIWADVVITIPADPSLVNASLETIDITTAAWKKMYEDAAGFRTENLQIVGWYHTHLDSISTRFSAVDRSTQYRAFTYEYSFGVVFNPNQEKWSAFYGPNSCECIGELLLDEELAARFRKPQITICQVNGDSRLQEDGRIIHFGETGPRAERSASYDTPEDDGGSVLFRQLFELLFGGLGRRISRPKSPTGSTLKIKIKKIGCAETKVKCVSYSISSGNTLVERFEYNCMVKKKSIEEIVRYKQRDPGCLTEDGCLWSYVKETDTGIKISLSVSREEANTVVVFMDQGADIDYRRFVMEEIRKVIKENIWFLVLVKEDSSQCVFIRLIRLQEAELL